MDNEKLIRFMYSIKNRFEILEYSLEVAEIKIKVLETLLLNDEQKSSYISQTRGYLKEHLKNHQNSELQKLLNDLDTYDDF